MQKRETKYQTNSIDIQPMFTYVCLVLKDSLIIRFAENNVPQPFLHSSQIISTMCLSFFSQHTATVKMISFNSLRLYCKIQLSDDTIMHHLSETMYPNWLHHTEIEHNIRFLVLISFYLVVKRFYRTDIVRFVRNAQLHRPV